MKLKIEHPARKNVRRSVREEKGRGGGEHAFCCGDTEAERHEAARGCARAAGGQSGPSGVGWAATQGDEGASRRARGRVEEQVEVARSGGTGAMGGGVGRGGRRGCGGRAAGRGIA